ncbi:MAG: hypothetical protein RI973_1335 [Bacteroidota bacterium]|jgi:hypothetical protein
MKKGIFSTCLVLAFLAAASAQEKPVKFTVQVSTDSILMDNYFEVKFTLENANGRNFEAPDFSQHFKVISGPNFSTSMSMVNGDVTQSMTITYYLEPLGTGSFYILPASVEASGQVLETAPLEVMVVPNPEGIRQSPSSRRDSFRQDSFRQFGWDQPFEFDFHFPFEELQDRMQQTPAPPQERKVAPKGKKKSNTIRI